jgi:putative transposase
MAAYLMESHQTSIGRACRVVSLPRSMYYYKTTRDDTAVIDKLRELSEAYPTRGSGSVLQPYPPAGYYLEL